MIVEPSSQAETWLVEKVRQHARAAGIDMPEVAIYDSPQPNAFATGARRNSALVAVGITVLIFRHRKGPRYGRPETAL